jgi:hypothetical protein
MSNFRQKTCPMLMVTASLLILPRILAADETYQLVDNRQPDDIVQVKVTVATQGVVQGASLRDKKDQKVEMSVRGQLAYAERLLTAGPEQTTVRSYSTASAQMVVGEHAETNALNPQRNVIVATQDQTARLWSPVAPLTRQEFDLLNAPACSLAVYGLLPRQPVAIGATWRPAADKLAGVLRLDHVGVNQTQMKLVDVARGLARIQLTGSIKGSVDGATTEMLLTGDVRYDLRWNHVTWLQLNIQENREEGPISVPYVARADVRMLISPIQGESEVGQIPASIATERKNRSDTLRYASAVAGLEVLHNNAWHVTAEDGRRATLRLIDKSKVVAQCNISRLPNLPAGKQLALEEFQADIRKALGDQFGEFESAKKSPGPDGLHTLRVAARGIVTGIPIRWIYYHVADSRGRRAAYVFTLSDEMTEKFAARDQLLVDSIRFAETGETSVPPVETANAPQTQR